MPDKITDYLASIGKKGGEAGTGKAKRRTTEQYREMAKKSAQVRKKRAADSGSLTKGK
jgi:hypothetical protein